MLAGSEIRDARWLDLVARLMLQDALEAKMVRESASSGYPGDPFNWTPTEPGIACRWEPERAKYIGYLQPRAGYTHHDHLENLTREFPIFQLEDMVIRFLTELIATLRSPVLIQLERGELDGLSHAETLIFQDQAGL